MPHNNPISNQHVTQISTVREKAYWYQKHVSIHPLVVEIVLLFGQGDESFPIISKASSFVQDVWRTLDA